MDRKIKYTSDGKKVVVIGALNSQETIVQEIFIIEGQEIPSGENFVVKSLHDAVAVSWKEQELKRLESLYDSESKKLQGLLDTLQKNYRSKSNELKEKLRYTIAALGKEHDESLQNLIDYISGDIQWMVIEEYEPALVSIKDFNVMYENKMRLLSIFGKDDGSFSYAFGEYYDYSGNNKRFHPFKTYEQALAKFKDVLLSKDVTTDRIKVAAKHGINYPQEMINAFVDEKVKNIENNIKSNLDLVAKSQDSLEEIKKLRVDL